MYPRLKIAQQLLKDDGVIFVSIDDNEQTNLKLLMDDVFGESNFVGQFTINSTPNARDYGHIGKMHDYALFYTKNNMMAETFLIPEEDKSFKYIDNKGEFNIHPLYNSNIAFTKKNRPNLYYPFYLYPDKKQNDFFEIGLKKEDKTIEIYPPKSQKEGIQFVWRWGKKKSMENINQEIIGYKTEDGEYRIVQKMRNSEKIIRSLLLKKEFINRKGTAELEELFNVKFFNFPKPISLIKLFVQATTKDNDIILDFFAGSATTAHAVMSLNAEDGGNRKFIMVQLDEETNPDSEARKAKYNTIDEIARDRILRAGKKILADYESDLVKKSNDWDKDIGFKHYRLITPNVKTLEKIVEFKPEETNLIADDMIKPFEYKKTETGGLDTILTTWLIDDGFRFNTHAEEIVFGKYKANYVREAATLYLINQDWDTAALMDMLNQIGKNILPVATIVVYPYSFTFEAMRELKTNIKTNLDNSPNIIERF
jgi:adenine specific DNA methylase Mod